MLSSIRESVDGIVDGRALRVGWHSHVVALVIGPVHRLLGLGAHSGRVSPVGVQVTGGLTITTNRGDGLGNVSLGGIGNVALERSHVHLISATDRVVDPEPTAHAQPIGTGRQSGDVESLELASNAVVDNGEDDEIRRLHVTLLGLVCNSESTSCNIGVLGGVDVGRAKSVHAVGPGIGDVAGCVFSLAAESTSHGGESLVSGNLKIDCASSHKLRDGISCWGVAQRFGSMPPL